MKPKTPIKKIEIESKNKREREILEKKKDEIKTASSHTGNEKNKKKFLTAIFLIGLSLFLSALSYLFTKDVTSSIIIFISISIATNAYVVYREKYRAPLRIRKIEEVFP